MTHSRTRQSRTPHSRAGHRARPGMFRRRFGALGLLLVVVPAVVAAAAATWASAADTGPEPRTKAVVDAAAQVELIAATTTDAGLIVRAELDENKYPKGVKVSDARLAAVNLDRHSFHGDWNYTISPNRRNPPRQKPN